MLAALRRAFFDCPAGFEIFLMGPGPGEEEEHLAFDVRRYLSPGLFIAVYRLDRDAQQFGNLFLGLVQDLAGLEELVTIHGNTPDL